jgi:hypothetical protein
LEKLETKDKDKEKPDCPATRKARKAALTFLLCECFGLDISLKRYKVGKTPRKNINPH